MVIEEIFQLVKSIIGLMTTAVIYRITCKLVEVVVLIIYDKKEKALS